MTRINVSQNRIISYRSNNNCDSYTTETMQT